jgi:hypothetical protein
MQKQTSEVIYIAAEAVVPLLYCENRCFYCNSEENSKVEKDLWVECASLPYIVLLSRSFVHSL